MYAPRWARLLRPIVGVTTPRRGLDPMPPPLIAIKAARLNQPKMSWNSLCGLDSQKAKNLARDDRAEAEKVLRMLPLKYPAAPPLPIKRPTPDEVRLFRVTEPEWGVPGYILPTS